MANIYCERCKKFHNPSKKHTQIEKDIDSGDIIKMLYLIHRIIMMR